MKQLPVAQVYPARRVRETGARMMWRLLVEKERLYTIVGRENDCYANNENQRYCTENGITTCFVCKGPKPKDEEEEKEKQRQKRRA